MNNNDSNDEMADDQLAQLPAERLAQMLREKRKSEGNYRTQLREAEAERTGSRRRSRGISGRASTSSLVAGRSWTRRSRMWRRR